MAKRVWRDNLQAQRHLSLPGKPISKPRQPISKALDNSALLVRSFHTTIMSFPAQFRTPSPRPPSSEHLQSSPVKPVAQHFAEHKRDEVQDYAYNKHNHQLDPFKTKKAFLGFLAVSEDILKVKTPTEAMNKFSLDNFVPAANALANP
jgi:hypothetical protein